MLTRKINEAIVIQGNIVVRVLGIEGERIRLGIDAPREVMILREEIAEAIRQENLAASQAQAQMEGAVSSLKGLLRRAEPS